MATTKTVKVKRGTTYGQALAAFGNPIRANYTFAGWNTMADGSGEERLPTDVVAQDETIYAQWNPNTLNVSYPARPAHVSSFLIYKNGVLEISNPSSAGSFTVNYGDTVYATANPSTGYFSPSITGVSTSSSNPTTVTSAVSIGITAGSPRSYTLTLHFDNGQDPVSHSVTYDSQIGDLPTPTKEGYIFSGWKIDGTTITSSTIWTYSSNQSAYAQWTLIKTNNLISKTGAAIWSVVATYTVTSTLTVTCLVFDTELGETRNLELTIPNGETNSNTAQHSVYEFREILSISPSEDGTYYYIF